MLGGKYWLVPASREAFLSPENYEEHQDAVIRMIRDHNGYYSVPDQYAEVDNIVFYKKNGKFTHLAIVTCIDPDGTIWVWSKPSEFAPIPHKMHDPKMEADYGTPSVQHNSSDRVDHLLLTKEQWEAKQRSEE